jgi:hypothetical protein
MQRRMSVLMYSTSVSADGFITDRKGGFEWSGAKRGAVYEHYARTVDESE